jgi:hypothetical protein
MAVYKNDPPTIIEHTTVQPVVERTTVIERDSWYSEPWAIALIIGAVAVIGLIAYWALYSPSNTAPSVVSNTTIERTLPDQRAQTINNPAPIVVNSTPPTVNVTTPAPPATSNTTPPVVINNSPSGTSNTTPDSSSNGNSTPNDNGNGGSSNSGSNDNSGNNGPSSGQ